MVGVRIKNRRKRWQAEDKLIQMGPIRYLRDGIILLTNKQFEALKEMKVNYELVGPKEIQEKLKGVILL